MKKKVKPIMLPTENKNGNLLNKCIQAYTEEDSWSVGQLAPWGGGHVDYWENQHLYLTSNEEIKEGDWCIHKQDEIPDRWANDESFDQSQYDKIIASTDESLGKCDKCKKPQTGNYTCSCNLLPSIPELFIKEYAEANGEIDEVYVEWIEAIWFRDELQMDDQPKKTDNNEVIIYPVEEKIEQICLCAGYVGGKKCLKCSEEKMYSRDEVVEIINKLNNSLPDTYSQMNKEELTEWINENL